MMKREQCPWPNCDRKFWSSVSLMRHSRAHYEVARIERERFDLLDRRDPPTEGCPICARQRAFTAEGDR